MPAVREPRLQPVAIADLRPTQITVGLREVTLKRESWRGKSNKKAGTFLGKHIIPVVLGPKSAPYVIDHHHLARALHDEGVQDVFITVIADLSALDRETFWVVLDHRGWTHPFDAHGRRQSPDVIPKSVKKLVDDPFRSLAGALRRAGGFAKDTTPYSEFLWADFFRRRMKLKTLEHDFDAALKRALKLARGPDANYLPGWCGPTD
jgi:hypothetical protein